MADWLQLSFTTVLLEPASLTTKPFSNIASANGKLASCGRMQPIDSAFKCLVPPLIKRAITLALLGIFLGRLGHAEAFGRFGFLQQLDLAGMRVDREGIMAKTPNADLIAFAKPSKSWKATITSDSGQTVTLDTNARHARARLRRSLYAAWRIALLRWQGLELHLRNEEIAVSDVARRQRRHRRADAKAQLGPAILRWAVGAAICCQLPAGN